MEKILFISHVVNRTGAPLVLLQFLQWLSKKKPKIKITLLTLEEGNLNHQFKSIVHEYIVLPNHSFPRTRYQRVIQKFSKKQPNNLREERIIEKIINENFDLIFANTIVTIPIAVKLKGSSKLIVHVHEMETAISWLLPNLKNYMSDIDGFIAVSEKVKENLVANHGVPAEKVEKIYEFTTCREPSLKKKSKPFVVRACGTAEWRKGVDVFVQVIIYISQNFPEYEIDFCWIGFLSDSKREKIEFDLVKAGVKNKISFTGEVEDPYDHHQDFDVFLLTSREDPFPLVCIEVGMLGKPIICFKDATGTEEILINGGGEIVPFMNIRKIVEAIVTYYDNPKKLQDDGAMAKQLFEKFTAENQAPKIENFINKIINQ